MTMTALRETALGSVRPSEMAVIELPRTALGFEERFGTEEACVAYLRRQRWSEGFLCPKCQGTRAWQLRARALDECVACGHQASLTAGTVFEGTRKPLRLWFRVIAQLLVSKSGCSATDIAHQHGVAYQTAWTWLHKLRSCMDRSGAGKLTGEVEVDETYVGGEDEEKYKGRSLRGKKSLVAGAAECRGEGIGRIRLSQVERATALQLCGFVAATVAPGTAVRTDGLQSYRSLGKQGFDHRRIVIGVPKMAHTLFPRIHRVFSLLDRWLLGTYQGCASDKHRKRYLDEFVFRFNRRSVRNRWSLFDRLIPACFRPAPTYRELTAMASLQIVAP